MIALLSIILLISYVKCMTDVFLSNSLTKRKEVFYPLSKDSVKMYACGPTVYERPHMGNARAAVVYDILFRLLKHFYKDVVYVRNITDVDDKIINSAKSQNIAIDSLTTQITQFYHQDVAELNCLPPNVEPKATTHIKQMIEMIEQLIKSSHAYVVQGHVLFDVSSHSNYGELANRLLDEMIAGARVEVAPFKKNPADFVLWKPCEAEDYGFESPWGRGRPGWHIECSAMSFTYLGADFDIHGGGADLMFPHHENELAQSKCANSGASFARYWVHNGFLTVNGEKMSKSLGNFKTVREIIESGFNGSVIRYFYLTTHYKKPLDLNDKALEDAKKAMKKISAVIHKTDSKKIKECHEVINFLADDMNTSAALAHLHELASKSQQGDEEANKQLLWSLDFLGLEVVAKEVIPADIIKIAQERLQAKKEKDWQLADLLRAQIMERGYKILDTDDSYELEKIG